MTREDLFAPSHNRHHQTRSPHTAPSHKTAQSQREVERHGTLVHHRQNIKLHLQQTTFHSSSVLNAWLCSAAGGKGMVLTVVETPVSTVPRVSLKERFQLMHQQPPDLIRNSLIFKQIILTLYALRENCKL